MELHYIKEEPAEGNHAGNKARRDVDMILARRGCRALENIVETRFGSALEKARYAMSVSTWQQILRLRRIRDLDVIAQFPTYGNKLMRAALNDFFDRNRMILIVHDLDALRNFGSAQAVNEIDRLTRARAAIVHNTMMLGTLERMGVTTPMIPLELFDYLLDVPPPPRTTFDRRIVFAGNLAKSEFLRSIGELNVEFNLYGPGVETLETSERVHYVGSFTPEEIPYRLEGGFGLIWDGNSIDTCAGAFGNYLRLNNPHKLSLYIAAGLPVVTWKGAAIARFVNEHGIGFTVGSLRELPNVLDSIDEDRYRTYSANSARLQSRVIEGWYTNRALDRIENILGDCHDTQ